MASVIVLSALSFSRRNVIVHKCTLFYICVCSVINVLFKCMYVMNLYSSAGYNYFEKLNLYSS